MNQFKPAQVFLLPNINGILYKSPNGNPNFDGGLKLVSDFDEGHYKRIEGFNRAYHLYIISDDEIKEGDWVYDSYFRTTSKPIFKNDGKHCTKETVQLNSGTNSRYSKIIATTDKSLKVGYVINHDPDALSTHTNLEVGSKSLPQPSQQFITKYIEEYNNGNVITDVLVEYDKCKCKCSYERGNIVFHSSSCKDNKLKINTKDNTITIKKLKDN